MPSSRGDRPVRSTKKVQLTAGYVDSSTLLFDSDDEGTDDAKREGEHDSEDEGNNEGDGDRHITKKPRLGGKFKAQAKEVPPPPPDSSCLAYYPRTYAAIQRWNKMLGLPPPHPMSDAATNKLVQREVDSPGAYPAKTSVPHGFGPPDLRVVDSASINKNPSYDETKAGFEKLPGEIRSRCLPLDLLAIAHHYKYWHKQRVGSYKGRDFYQRAILNPEADFVAQVLA